MTNDIIVIISGLIAIAAIRLSEGIWARIPTPMSGKFTGRRRRLF